VPLDRTLSDTTRFPVLYPTSLPPSHASLYRPLWFSTRQFPSTIGGGIEPLGGIPRADAGTRASPKWIDLSICLVKDYDVAGGHASPRCFAYELVLLVCCALIRQAGERHECAAVQAQSRCTATILLCPSARVALRFSRGRDSDKRVLFDPNRIEI